MIRRRIVAVTAALLTIGGLTAAHHVARASTAGALYDGDLTTSFGQTYRVQNASKAYSLKRTDTDPGHVVYRFEVRQGDQWPNDAAHYTDGRQRDELRDTAYLAPDADVTITYDVRWSGTKPDKWTTITQLHAELEDGEPAGKPAPVAIQWQSGALHLYSRADTDPLGTDAPQVDRFSWPLPAANVWQTVSLHVHLDPWGNGLLQLSLDGVVVFDSGPVAVGYNDVQGPYLKFGIYRGASSADTVFEFRDAQIR